MSTYDLYIFKLEDDTFFVESRETGSSGEGELATLEKIGDKRITNIINKYTECNQEDIDKCVIYHMYLHGIDNVRGGKFTNQELSEEDHIYIKAEFNRVGESLRQRKSQMNQENTGLGGIIKSVFSIFSHPEEQKPAPKKQSIQKRRSASTYTLPTYPPESLSIVDPNKQFKERVIGINVGGTEFVVKKHPIAQRLPILDDSTDDNTNLVYYKDGIKYYYFDRDPSCFKDILFWIRYNEVRLSQNNGLKYFLIDLKFMGVNLFETTTLPFNKTIIHELPENNIIKGRYCIADNDLLNLIVPGTPYLKSVDNFNHKLKEYINQFGDFVFLAQPGKKEIRLNLLDVYNILMTNILVSLKSMNYYIHAEPERLVVYWL